MFTVGIVDTFPSNGVARIVHNCAKESAKYPALKIAGRRAGGKWLPASTACLGGLGSLSFLSKSEEAKTRDTRIRMPSYVPPPYTFN